MSRTIRNLEPDALNLNRIKPEALNPNVSLGVVWFMVFRVEGGPI